MKLSRWIEKSSTYELRQLAQRVRCHPQYLYQIRKDGCSAGLAKKIEKATKELTPGQVVTKEDLRPDIWED